MVGTRRQFSRGCRSAYCDAHRLRRKGQYVGADGTRSETVPTHSSIPAFEEIARDRNNAQDAGCPLLQDLQSREAKALAKAKSLEPCLSGYISVFWFSCVEIGADHVAGQQGLPAYMDGQLGVENVVTSAEEWPLVGWGNTAEIRSDLHCSCQDGPSPLSG